jgi:hypothetical protein
MEQSNTMNESKRNEMEGMVNKINDAYVGFLENLKMPSVTRRFSLNAGIIFLIDMKFSNKPVNKKMTPKMISMKYGIL